MPKNEEGRLFKQDLVDQNLLDHLLKLLAPRLTASCDALELSIRSEALLIIARLCDEDNHTRELLGAEGIETVLAYLRIDPCLFSKNLGHQGLVLASIDVVWCGVASNALNEKFFLEQEGVFLLLDLLARCPFSMQNMVFGCLLDVCENEDAMSHTVQWRHPDDFTKTAAHLMCRIWREEEVRLVSEGLSVASSSHSISEVSSTMRSKIYAFMTRTGVDVFMKWLGPEECVTLQAVSSYLSLKEGEVWQEVRAGLDDAAIMPTEADNEYLDLALRKYAEDVEVLKQKQAEILVVDEVESANKLEMYYGVLRDQRRGGENAAAAFKSFVARTSSHTKLKEARTVQLATTARSRNVQEANDRFVENHNVDIEDEDFGSTVRGKTVILTSTLMPGADGRELLATESRGPVDLLAGTVELELEDAEC